MRVLSKMDQHYLASFLFSAKISIPAKILARSLATDPLSGTRQIFSEFSFSFDFFRTRQFIGEFTCLRPCLENSPRVTLPCNLARSPSLVFFGTAFFYFWNKFSGYFGILLEKIPIPGIWDYLRFYLRDFLGEKNRKSPGFGKWDPKKLHPKATSDDQSQIKNIIFSFSHRRWIRQSPRRRSMPKRELAVRPLAVAGQRCAQTGPPKPRQS